MRMRQGAVYDCSQQLESLPRKAWLSTGLIGDIWAMRDFDSTPLSVVSQSSWFSVSGGKPNRTNN